MADVTMVRCPDYAPDSVRRALSEALGPIGGLDFVRPGMRVAIKANLVTAIKPEKAATTHPALLAELTRMLVARGATVVVGDSPGGPFLAPYLNRVYQVTGLSAVEAAGGELNRDFGERAFLLERDGLKRTYTFTSWLMDADAIISFSKLKTHGMMALSCAVKNLFGAIPGTMKPEYHFRYSDYAEFADMLIDLNLCLKPSLCLCDGVLAMEGNGPTAGTPRQVGVLLASASPFALDLCCAHLVNLEPDNVPTIVRAAQRGLAPEAFSCLDVAGDAAGDAVCDFKNLRQHNRMDFGNKFGGAAGRAFSGALKGALASKPMLKRDACVGCGRCAEACPAKAITVVEGKAEIDRKKCIRCFCCQEFCPKGAMRVRRSAVARLLNRGAK